MLGIAAHETSASSKEIHVTYDINITTGDLDESGDTKDGV